MALPLKVQPCSGSDVFAVGRYGTIVHYDGSAWSPMSSGTGQGLRSIWGGSDVFAVGGLARLCITTIKSGTDIAYNF